MRVFILLCMHEKSNTHKNERREAEKNYICVQNMKNSRQFARWKAPLLLFTVKTWQTLLKSHSDAIYFWICVLFSSQISSYSERVEHLFGSWFCVCLMLSGFRRIPRKTTTNKNISSCTSKTFLGFLLKEIFLYHSFMHSLRSTP